MKNEKLFNETIDILVKAYQKGDLEYSDCAKCAVGNIVSARNNGISRSGNIAWSFAVKMGEGKIYKEIPANTIKLIKTTGYDAQQLASIEQSFYWGCFGYTNHEEAMIGDEIHKEDQFKGLMKVVDCLMIIHEANEVQVKEAKQLFVKEIV